MKLLSHFGIAALVGFSASCLILLATYALGVWPWIVTATISWITYRSVSFALLVGLAAAVQPGRLMDRWGGLLVAILLGSILGFLYTFFVIGFSLAAAAFVALALSCWVPGGISAMVAAAFGKRLSVVAGIAVLCLSITERMVRRATLEMAFTPGRTNDGKTIERRIEKQTGSYGFGWSIGSFEGNLTLEHAGVWSGYFNYIMRVPSRQITAVVLTNSSNGKMVAIAHKMIGLAGK